MRRASILFTLMCCAWACEPKGTPQLLAAGRDADVDPQTTDAGEPPVAIDVETCESGVAVGSIDDARLNEASGLVASRRHEGILWAHNDSGESELRVFGIDAATAKVRSVYTLAGVHPFDVEDITRIASPSGADVLLLADIGDNRAREQGGQNGRDHVQLYAVAEPDPSQREGVASLLYTLELDYPDGPHDAEALFVDPIGGALYVFAKETFGPSNYYRLAPPFAGGRRTLELVGQVPVGTSAAPGLMITAASVRNDGSMFALRTYTSLLLFPRLDAEDPSSSFARGAYLLPHPDERQSEASTFSVQGDVIFTTPEGLHQPLHATPTRCVDEAVAAQRGP